MDLILTGKIKKGAILIEGFPGLGLVGSIATDFLIDHLKAKSVGMITGDKVPPLAAIHQKNLIKPLGLYYSPTKNILLLHVLSPIPGSEWKIANLIQKKINEIGGSIISLESVGISGDPPKGKKAGAYYYSTEESAKKKLKKIGISQLEEGIVMGVTGALMLSMKKNLTCIFAETHSTLPDSRAAARLIECLNDFINLKIDVKPLFKSAEQFENKVKTLLEKGKEATERADQNKIRYVG